MTSTNKPDATKLTFPTQLVITLISTVVSIVVTVMATTWSMKSDIRDIGTRMELRDKSYEVSISELKKDVKMMQVDITNIQLHLAEVKGERPKDLNRGGQ